MFKRFLLLALLDKGLLTVAGVGQGRDLSLYERVDLGSVRNASASAFADARLFLWEHWSKQKLGYLTLTGSSVDATSTSHIFIERDKTGRWRVAWIGYDRAGGGNPD